MASHKRLDKSYQVRINLHDDLDNELREEIKDLSPAKMDEEEVKA